MHWGRCRSYRQYFLLPFLCTTYICNIITYKYMFGSILQVVWVCFAGLWQTSQERGISSDMLQGKVHAEEWACLCEVLLYLVCVCVRCTSVVYFLESNSMVPPTHPGHHDWFAYVAQVQILLYIICKPERVQRVPPELDIARVPRPLQMG